MQKSDRHLSDKQHDRIVQHSEGAVAERQIRTSQKKIVPKYSFLIRARLLYFAFLFVILPFNFCRLIPKNEEL